MSSTINDRHAPTQSHPAAPPNRDQHRRSSVIQCRDGNGQTTTTGEADIDVGGHGRPATHRGHATILERLLIHCGAFNLGLLMRQLIGVGTPRGLQGRRIAAMAALLC